MSIIVPQMWWPGINREHSLARGLVAHYPIWEGAGIKAQDVVAGNGSLDGTLTGGPTWVGSPYGYALDFAWGTSQYVNVGDLSQFFSTEASVLFYLRLRNANPVHTDATGLCPGGGGGALHYPYPGGDLYINAFATSRRINAYDNSGFDKSKWHQLVITSSPGAGNYKLYQNAQLTTTGIGDATISGVAAWTIGFYAGDYIDGWVAQSTLWSRALAPSEIQQLYADPHILTRLKQRVSFPTAAVGGALLTRMQTEGLYVGSVL